MAISGAQANSAQDRIGRRAAVWRVQACGKSDSAAELQRLLQRHLESVATRRDEAAFMVLFDHYAPRLKAYMKRLGAGEDVAEDLVQEVMLSVWRKAASYDPAKAALSTWIFTIARNLRIDALRRDRRPALDAEDPMLAPAPLPMPDSAIDAAEQQQRVRAALAELPREQAQVVTLAFYESKSHGEIAAELRIPLGTVKSRLRLACQRIRGLLESEEEGSERTGGWLFGYLASLKQPLHVAS